VSTWQPIETVPIGQHVLIFFKASRHVEDAWLHTDDNGDWYYTLFDGETLNDRPSHWAPFVLPEAP
jgi:hypothetical protein